MRAANRQELPLEPTKSSRFPRTERRSERITSVLAKRQPDLTVILENVHDPHNIGAVLRSCDAVGVQAVHTIYTVETRPERAYSRLTSSGTRKWIDLFHHDSHAACFDQIHTAGFRILTAALSETANSLYATDLTQPVALLFGNEQRGASAEALAASDGFIEIPMMGMVESLNISVACAVTLFEALRQRQAAGFYDQPRLSSQEQERLATEWITR
ncbi:MAG TPA: RNA methyltransferase [Thermomicrobiales bacterium]|nr:RNA methyltransferase [Thermomicrobiales bacterium]